MIVLNQVIEAIGLKPDEADRFFKLGLAFLEDVKRNPLDPFYTPVRVLPVLVELAVTKKFLAKPEEIATELAAFLAVNHFRYFQFPPGTREPDRVAIFMASTMIDFVNFHPLMFRKA